MKNYHFLVFVVLVSLLCGCVSQRYVKRGVRYEQAGMYGMAAEMYYQAKVANPRNVDAGIGLMRNGQRLLDDLGMAVGSAYLTGDDRATVYSYLEARAYSDKVKSTGINLTFPVQAQRQFDEVKVRYLPKQFDEARLLLEEDKFKEAEELFSEIKRIDPSFKGVDDYMRVSQCEPIYRKGMELLAKGLYRSAWGQFNQIITSHGPYKDAVEMRSQALEGGMLSISIEPIKHKGRERGAATIVESKIIREISQLKNPFLRVVDSRNTERFVAEQAQGATRGANIQVGQLLAAKAVLSGTIVSIQAVAGELQRTDRKGWVKEEVETKTKMGEVKTEVKYHKVIYQEYRSESSASITFQYQLSSIETGEILLSDVIRLSDSDEVHYATFTGDKNNLLPGHWEKTDKELPTDKVEDTPIAARNLQRLLSASRVAKPAEQMLEDLMDVIGQRVAQKINQYNPEI